MKKYLLILVFCFSIIYTFAQWQHSNDGLPSDISVRDFTTTGSDICIATSHGVYLSNNNGYSWTAKNNGLTELDISCVESIGQNIYAGGNGLFLSTNNGNNWTKILNEPVSSILIDSSNIIVSHGGAGYGILLSIDYGNTWDTINNGLPSSGWWGIGVSALLSMGENYFAGVIANGAYYSDDISNNWYPTDTVGLSGDTYIIYDFASNGTTLFAATANGLYKTMDYGTNWLNINPDSSWEADEKGLYCHNGYLFTSIDMYTLNSWYVYLSTDNGLSWSDVSYGLTDTSCVNSFLIIGNDVLCATYSWSTGGDGIGVWRRPLSEMLSIHEFSNNSFFKIYPSPVNNIITIEQTGYNQTIKGVVSIYDINGVKLFQQTIRKREEEIDVSRFANGVYFVKIEGSEILVVKKIIKN